MLCCSFLPPFERHVALSPWWRGSYTDDVMVSWRFFRTTSVLAALWGASACGPGFDGDKLPEPRASDGRLLNQPDAQSRDPKKLARASLMLAADSGNVDLIEVLRKNSREIDWTVDGPVAMQFAARRGYVAVVRQLAGYGVCGDRGEACDDALSEAEAKDHREIVTILRTLRSP